MGKARVTRISLAADQHRDSRANPVMTSGRWIVMARDYADTVVQDAWDEHRSLLVWEAIAVRRPAREVALAHLGVHADFTGPLFPGDDGGDFGGVIAVDEYREVLARFPLAGSGSAGVQDIMCGLYRDKPATTFDNFAGDFGAANGVDGRGAGRERNSTLASMVAGLDFEVAYGGRGGERSDCTTMASEPLIGGEYWGLFELSSILVV
ncbi:hypothetical protein AAE478_006300 [Parahypoxylon ruwenzoriense]